MVSLGEIAFWSLEGGDTFSCPEGNDPPPPARPPSLMLCVLGTVIKAWHVSTPSSHCTVSTAACAARPSKRPQGPELTGSECETTQLSTLAAARVTHVAKR